MNQDLTTMLPN